MLLAVMMRKDGQKFNRDLREDKHREPHLQQYRHAQVAEVLFLNEGDMVLHPLHLLLVLGPRALRGGPPVI